MKTHFLSRVFMAGLGAVLLGVLTLAWPRGLRADGFAYTPRGTPYVWLSNYSLVTDEIDDDGDGWFTWQEYRIGGNPTNADDFAVSAIAMEPAATVHLEWPSSSSGSTEPYWVRFTTNLMTDASAWPVIGISPRTPPTNTWDGPGFTNPGFLCVEATYSYSPGVTLGISPPSISEPSGVATVTATLSASYYLPVLVRLAFSGTAALGADYTRSATNILIPPGMSSGSLTLNVQDDDLVEGPESVVVSIIDVDNGHEVGEQSVTTWIESEDPEPPRIKVVKDAVPNDPQDFDFSGDLGRFRLDDDDNPVLPNTQWFGPLEPDTYGFVEMEAAGWYLDALEIEDPDGGSAVSLGDRSCKIDLDAGETVVVTFRNNQYGSITVVKDTVPDAEQVFSFEGSLGEFNLMDFPDSPLGNSQTFNNLAPGKYGVLEQEAAGWDLVDIAVEDPDHGSTTDLKERLAVLDLDPGEHIRVTFLNHSGRNNPPVADAGGPYEVPEGSGATLDASGSSDPDEPIGDAIVKYEWDLDNNGIFERTAVPEDNPILVLSAPELAALGMVDGWSLYPVGVRVTDSLNATGQSSAEIAIINVPPKVSDLTVTPRVDEGGAVTLSGTIVDPGPDTFMLQLDWGDGMFDYVDLSAPGPGVTFDPVTRVFTVGHSFPDDGTSPGNLTAWDLMPVGGTVMDDDGGMSTMSGGWTPMLANDDNETGWTVTQQIQVGEPIGQTFTAISGNRLATIAMYVADMNESVAPTDYSVTFELYEGIGTGGRLLGRREYTGLADDFEGWIEADFSSVTLTDGAVYTMTLDNDTARWGRVACGNQYGGGTAMYAGSPSPTADALFRVQWQAMGMAPQVANDDNETGWTVTQQIQVGAPIGQTFTAVSDNRLAAISMYVADMNESAAPTDYSVTFELYEGSGTGGRRLGRREYTGLSDGFQGWIEADFSSVTLVEGAIYTVVLDNDTARWGRVACGNQYAGGTALYAGSPSPTSDALFRVQWQPDGEPPMLAHDDNDTGWTVTQQIQAGAPIGQTFTAISGNRLSSISMYVADMNAGAAPADYSVTFELYEGSGTGGRLLGRREYTALSDGFSGFVEANLSSVTLKEGEVYTAVLDNDTARWGRVACGNQYAGGTALYADSPSPTSDALFRMHWQPDGWAPMLANNDNQTGWTVTQQIQAGEPIGQTFTAVSGNRLSTISMYVADMNAEVAPADYSVTFELYEGVGTGGRLLGRREYTGLSDGFEGFISADFSSVTLEEGQMYTIVLDNDTQRWGRVACGNQYGGGTAMYAGAPSPTSDALFSINWQPDGGAPLLVNDDNDSGWSVTQQIQAGEPIGQTFTAISGSRLSTLSMYVADMNSEMAPEDHSVTFELYEGIGTGGRLLGRREYTSLTDEFEGFVTVDFSSVTLVEGQIYTMVLRNDTVRWGRVAAGNQYGGGTALYADSPSPTADALFRVEWFPDPGQVATVVANVPPWFEAGEDENLMQGYVFRNMEFTDPGLEDVHTVMVDYGDGSAPQTFTLPPGDRKFDIQHGYRELGTYAISITVADDDLGSCTDGFNVIWTLGR